MERMEELRRYGQAICFTSATAQVLLSLSWACAYMGVLASVGNKQKKRTCGMLEAEKVVKSLCGQGFQINVIHHGP